MQNFLILIDVKRTDVSVRKRDVQPNDVLGA